MMFATSTLLLMMLQATALQPKNTTQEPIVALSAKSALPHFLMPDGKTVEVLMLNANGSDEAMRKAQARLNDEHWETKMGCWASGPVPMPGLCIAFANVAPSRAQQLMKQLLAGVYGQLNVRPIASEMVQK